jgi:hypothetical protein
MFAGESPIELLVHPDEDKDLNMILFNCSMHTAGGIIHLTPDVHTFEKQLVIPSNVVLIISESEPFEKREAERILRAWTEDA